MDLKKVILRLLTEKKQIKTRDVVIALKDQYSRQYVSRVLNSLAAEGRIVKVGHTTNTVYVLPGKQDEVQESLGNKIKLRLSNTSLKEHEVVDEINGKLPFIVKARESIRSIFDYAFSEMLNNAIEHSKSKFIEIEVSKEDNDLCFVVNDFGIGVFKNVMKKRGLKFELEAIQDLLKGKTTTEPQAHSGEGIFFTSKIADVFVLESFDYKLTIDNTIPDVFVEETKRLKKGTKVIFRIALTTKKHLSDLFKNFSSDPNEPNFDKTKVEIRLYTMGTIYVSRSQARRVLTSLDKFRHIILDYDKVPTIGQAFADEIYRVFQSRHPDIKIESTNTNEAVQFMIDRSKGASKMK
jgi:anti-sigma regulatory factor (Ser/Thr protein kinase)